MYNAPRNYTMVGLRHRQNCLRTGSSILRSKHYLEAYATFAREWLNARTSVHQSVTSQYQGLLPWTHKPYGRSLSSIFSMSGCCPCYTQSPCFGGTVSFISGGEKTGGRGGGGVRSTRVSQKFPPRAGRVETSSLEAGADGTEQA